MEIVIPVNYLSAAATILGGVILAGFAFHYWSLSRKLTASLERAIVERDDREEHWKDAREKLIHKELECRDSDREMFSRSMPGGLPYQNMLASLFGRLQATHVTDRVSVLNEYFRKNPSHRMTDLMAWQFASLCAISTPHKRKIHASLPRIEVEETNDNLPPWDASKCSCSHPPHRPPCSYCEGGNYSKAAGG